MSPFQPVPTDAEVDVPITPDAETWKAMTLEAREAYLAEALAALHREAEMMPEGSPDIRAKSRARLLLRDYFDRIGRKVYLNSELPVHYPEARPFAPDLMAVLDVEDPDDADERMAWVVVDEGRGLDLVMEVLHAGSPHKDLVSNVLSYAGLGIPEYFVYDRRKFRILGYRLPSSSSTRYEPIPSRGGVLHSAVLGLDLAVENEQLRFLHAGAEIPETRELLSRVNAMVENLERRADEEARRADELARKLEAETAARKELERQLAELRARLGED